MLSQGNHQFHMVDYSPWPFISGALGMSLMLSFIFFFHKHFFIVFLFSIALIFISSFQWWRDISREASFQGIHALKILSNMKWGMMLFIVSEVMFFLSFFWCFFHLSLSPDFEVGAAWPPLSVVPFNPFQVPLLNTIILVSSGVTVTWSHYSLLNKDFFSSKLSLLMTVFLGLYFTFVQGYEYMSSPFSLSDSSFGAIFFTATGFHGLHVLIGTIMLISMMLRMLLGHFSSVHHFGFEAASWYWHFVDVVWLFLFSAVYWWGG